MNTVAPLSTLSVRDDWTLDDRTRGVPVGTTGLAASAVGAAGWHPADGRMQLPVLTLDETAYAANRDLFLGFLKKRGAFIAPHAKTPMSPDIARDLVAAGAFGATVADVRQATVMLRAGLNRLILANEVGGIGGARRLAALIECHPNAELYAFADSVAAVEALAHAWQEKPSIPPLRVLPELGAGRAGARTVADFTKVADAVLAADGRLILAGVGGYEGSASRPTLAGTQELIEHLLDEIAEAVPLVRARVAPKAPILVTAGGSGWFDLVIDRLKPVVEADGHATLVLRSGAIFFYDHGVYDRTLRQVDDRQGFAAAGVPAATTLRPTMRLWAEVLSRPEPNLAVCGMGMRDVSFDKDLPTALAVWRDGRRVGTGDGMRVTQLNDQHAFLELSGGAGVAVGDVIEFGISHPCTCFDRYRAVFGLGEDGRVRHAFQMFFG